MLNVAINGAFMAMRMQGIVRYARELVSALDEVIEDDDRVVVVMPRDAHDVPEYARVKVVRFGRMRGMLWEQVELAAWALAHRDLTLLSLCNVAPIVGKPGVTAIHDVMYRARPGFYTSARNRMSRLWHCAQYALLVRRELAILTVSEFSRGEIERYYPTARGKVRVVPDAWQHVLEYGEARDWRCRYPELVPGEYLFSMATLARNKNGRWVYEVARRNPSLTFAMAGKRYETDEIERPTNVRLLGFVSDEDACALVRNCRAFLFPSLYEGFGLPPLEALALGAQVISSNTTSLPEVLGDSVHYVDPCDYDVDLVALLNMPTGDATGALGRYSWDGSAGELATLLEDVRGPSRAGVIARRSRRSNRCAV